MKRSAFTMLELVFVIVVIAILSVLAMPNFNRNMLEEAAVQVADHIRYTQHLAMNDDKFDPNDATWYREKWQIRFRRFDSQSGYVIFSDNISTQGGIDNGERAIDPLTGEVLDGFLNYAPANLTNKYGIKGDDGGIVHSCNNPTDGSHVNSNRGVFAFDNIGRPYFGVSNADYPAHYLMTADCILTLTNNSNESIRIKVEKETGYVCILDNATGQCR